MKKKISIIMAATLCITALGACNSSNTNASDSQPTTNASETAKESLETETETEETTAVSNNQPVDWLSDYLADQAANAPSDAPVVYMTTEINPDSLVAIYEALDRTPSGKVAVKVHTGESEKSNNLNPDLIADLVHLVDGTFVECNTAYGGSRAETAMHRQMAIDHGYTAVAEVDIMDGEGQVAIPVIGGKHLTENYVGANFENYDFYVILSHFKGHAMGGFGGALKNTSIGIASSMGKSLIHSAGAEKTGLGTNVEQDAFLESMAEAAKSVSDYLGNGEQMVYINVMNRMSVDCDCDGIPTAPCMHDIGILASLDPVALDKACIDLVYAAPDGNTPGENGVSMIERIESLNGTHILDHAENIGLGSQTYQLKSLDD